MPFLEYGARHSGDAHDVNLTPPRRNTELYSPVISALPLLFSPYFQDITPLLRLRKSCGTEFAHKHDRGIVN
jgi:hypothetical protein